MIHLQCKNCGQSIGTGEKYIGNDCKCPSCGDAMVAKPIKTPTFWKWLFWEFIWFLLIVVGWVVVVVITEIFYSQSIGGENPGVLLHLAMMASFIYFLLVVVWLGFRRRKRRREKLKEYAKAITEAGQGVFGSDLRAIEPGLTMDPSDSRS